MLSIIVPVYNVEKVLRHCLNSLRFQSYRNIEIILIDEGSTDLSGAICDRFARVDPRFKVFHKKVKNFSEALDKGLHMAKGEYVSFINPVDRIDDLMIEKLLLTIIKNQADIVIANYGEELDKADQMAIEDSNTVIWTKEKALKKITDQFRLQSFLCNKLFAIDLFRSDPALEFDLTVDIFGDLLMSIQCILKSKKIIYDPNLHYHYIAYKHAPFFNELTKEKLSGPKTLLKIIELTKGVEKFDVSIIKEQYVNYSIQLLMHLLNEESKNWQQIKEAKQNLYHFSLNELSSQKVKKSCVLARKMTYIYFNIWKIRSESLD
ncbi:Glycosyltransferase [Carnobacterium sp. AT7]|uniref:glycosyltransferase family 2 protein n=1 Tax=Carnobacterium TaxID=2747 RepID=UPI00015F2C17|nr:glycosyltransferase family 2 protein [Carnobacterium sp. AT7]EDP67465.1 Glycosyltransferase [Carnobacterium sp. AT7]